MREQVWKEWSNLKVKFNQLALWSKTFPNQQPQQVQSQLENNIEVNHQVFAVLGKYSDKSSLVERIEVIDKYLTKISWVLTGITKLSEAELRGKMSSLSNLSFTKLPSLMLIIREYSREKFWWDKWKNNVNEKPLLISETQFDIYALYLYGRKNNRDSYLLEIEAISRTKLHEHFQKRNFMMMLMETVKREFYQYYFYKKGEFF